MEGYWITSWEVLGHLPVMNYYMHDELTRTYFIVFPENTKFIALEDRMIGILEDKQPLMFVNNRIRLASRGDVRLLPPKWQDYIGADYYKQV